MKDHIIKRVAQYQISPMPYIEDIWGLIPQPLKPEYTHLKNTLPADQFTQDMFMVFVKGKHITWQQWLTVRAVEHALLGIASPRITIESGHGTGKSMILALLVLWFLAVFKDSQIPCTAPTAPLMKDILWKEIAKWQKLMPEHIGSAFIITDGYLRHKASKDTWFARARTASKDTPEAMAGVHADSVFMVVDEASAVPEEVFEVMEGALTDLGGIILVILASNHTRNIGYFHDSHNSDSKRWQCLSYNSEYSPIVSHAYVENIISKYGKDSDQYRVRVQGKAPNVEEIDTKGYVQLIENDSINWIGAHNVEQFSGQVILGVDPAGGGKDTADWVARDQFVLMKVAEEAISTPKSIAEKTILIAKQIGIKKEQAYRIVVDQFGVGADVVIELIKAGWIVTGVNVGEKSLKDEYLNKRAEKSWAFRRWIINGGQVVQSKSMKELTVIKYKRTLSGKIQIMSKKEMAKEGIPSPNTFDAGMLTFPHEGMVDLESEDEYQEGYDGDEDQYGDYGI